jgi:hypothetical protein
MLSCKQVTELCSQEMERPLGLGERLSLRTHLMLCKGCTNFRTQMKTLRKIMSTYADGRALPPDSGDAGQGELRR